MLPKGSGAELVQLRRPLLARGRDVLGRLRICSGRTQAPLPGCISAGSTVDVAGPDPVADPRRLPPGCLHQLRFVLGTDRDGDIGLGVHACVTRQAAVLARAHVEADRDRIVPPRLVLVQDKP